jgi:mRNA interferase YafQ
MINFLILKKLCCRKSPIIDLYPILKQIIEKLQTLKDIEAKYKRHFLKGDIKEYEAIHIKPDWVLIFKIDDEYLNLIMIGKHTQVFKKFK